jgi:hypothetical protein
VQKYNWVTRETRMGWHVWSRKVIHLENDWSNYISALFVNFLYFSELFGQCLNLYCHSWLITGFVTRETRMRWHMWSRKVIHLENDWSNYISAIFVNLLYFSELFLVIYNNYFKQSEKLQKIWLSIINIYYRNPKFWRSCYWCYKASGES